MREDIRQYALIGLVHHLLYPRCMVDPDDHLRTLEVFVRRDDIETFDCCLPRGTERRNELISAIRACGKKEIAFATHLFPIDKLSLATTSPHEQAQVRMIAKDMVEQARAIGATGFVFPSGADGPEAERSAACAAFAGFCRWLCGELKHHGITAMLEPFDRDIDKKFLYGPTAECVELIRSLEPKVDNLGIELDVAHLPLMGESFEHAIRTTAPYCRRVHLGNCVLKNRDHPMYGDKHPAIGLEGGEIDVPELAEILALLLDTGYLSKQKRGALLLEMQPLPGRTAEETVTDSMARLHKAWERI